MSRFLFLALLLGCDSAAHVVTDGGLDAGTTDATTDAATADAATSDAATTDAATADAATTDGGRQIPCVFNAECPSDMRCFHTGNEESDDHCIVGARGTGRAGFDTCDETMGGADCASSLCVSGAPDGMSYCTDRCPATEIYPGTILTRCVSVFGSAPICLPASN